MVHVWKTKFGYTKDWLGTNLINILYDLFLDWKYETTCLLASLCPLFGHDNSTVTDSILTKFDIVEFVKRYRNTIELGYNIMKGTDCIVSLMSFVVTKEYNGMVNREINWYHRISWRCRRGFHINRCRYNRVRPCNCCG